jgi:hypothetical protein
MLPFNQSKENVVGTMTTTQWDDVHVTNACEEVEYAKGKAPKLYAFVLSYISKYVSQDVHHRVDSSHPASRIQSEVRLLLLLLPLRFYNSLHVCVGCFLASCSLMGGDLFPWSVCSHLVAPAILQTLQLEFLSLRQLIYDTLRRRERRMPAERLQVLDQVRGREAEATARRW